APRNDRKYINDWRGFANSADGEGTVVTYNFMTSLPDKPRIDPLAEINFGVTRYSAAEQRLINKALKVWASYADIKFVKSDAQDAGIRFGQHRMYEPVQGYAGTLNYDPANAEMRPTDIWMKSKGAYINNSDHNGERYNTNIQSLSSRKLNSIPNLKSPSFCY